MRRLAKSDIRLNEPLPWSIFDSNGTLLLRAGTVLSLTMHIDTLLERGIYVAAPESEPQVASSRSARVNVFHELAAIPLKLKPIFNALLSSEAGEDIPERIAFFGQSVLNLCLLDGDAALASVHINSHAGYLLSHHVHAAVLTALVGQSIGIEKAELSSLVNAALTFDISMFLNAHLEKTVGTLEEGMHTQIAEHPTISARFLMLAGIEDTEWIHAVLHHHERLNGLGYPHGLHAEQISRGAALLGLVDAYTSAIKQRPYRRAQTPRAILGALMQDSSYDASLSKHLARTITAYPPGSLVKLASGEVAVIKSRPGKQTGHIAATVFSALGVPLLRPVDCDTNLRSCVIQLAVTDDEYRAAEIVIRRVWNQS